MMYHLGKPAASSSSATTASGVDRPRTPPQRSNPTYGFRSESRSGHRIMWDAAHRIKDERIASGCFFKHLQDFVIIPIFDALRLNSTQYSPALAT